jgi:gliding motility-associated-like protein
MLVLISVQPLYAQLTIVQGSSLSLSPQQLVEQWLVGGGITVSNVKCNGSTADIATSQIGYFQTANQALQELKLDGGIIMTTGKANIAIGPNNSASAGAATSFNGDPDLELLLGSQTYDACILEFDFVPSCDSIKFRYVFGSEEFYEYCGDSTINDVFGFFLSGPGISGIFSNNSRNIATMPGTSQKVSIYNICNDPASNWDNSGGQWFQYDGMTHVFTAWHLVTPNQTYHIKIAIADAHDRNFDSGVFLEKNSFSSGTGLTVQQTLTNPALGNYSVEGCNNTFVTFKLANKTTSPFTINLAIGGTAINGTDYTQIQNTLTIPAGSDSATLEIIPLADTLTEGTETVILTANYYSCNGNSMISDTVYIHDHPRLTALAGNDTTVCAGTPVTLSAQGSGGIRPLTYAWNNPAGTDSTLALTPPVGVNSYIVTVTDICQLKASDTVMVTVNQAASLTNQPPSKSICNGDSTRIHLTADVANTQFTWIPVNPSSNISGYSAGTGPDINQVLTVSNGVPGTVIYHIVMGGNSCDTSSADYSVTVGPVTAVHLPDSVVMTHGSTTALSAGGGFVNYLWSTGSADSVITVDETGKYWVRVENSFGCTASDTTIVTELGLYIPNAFSPNNDGINDIFRITGLDPSVGFSLFIFNRIGEQVFFSDDPQKGWNGIIGNEWALAGTYAYVLTITSPESGKTTTVRGTVTLVR